MNLPTLTPLPAATNCLLKQLLIWVGANVLGFAVPGALLILIPTLTATSIVAATTLVLLFPISLVQGIVLRRSLNISLMWMFTMPLGLLLWAFLRVIVLDRFVIADDESILVLTAGYVTIGIAVGLPQWLILRRRFGHASIWVLGSAIGFSGGFWLVLVTDLVHQSGIISYILVALVYTIVTGATLMLLLATNNHAQAKLVNTT